MINRLKADCKRQGFAEFIRFCIVGVIATGIDAALFYAAKTIVPYQVALVIGYLTSLTVNYYLTTKWTFKVKQTWTRSHWNNFRTLGEPLCRAYGTDVPVRAADGT